MAASMMYVALFLVALCHIVFVDGTFYTKPPAEPENKDTNLEDRFLALARRVEELESRDLLQQTEFNDLKSRDRLQQAELNELKSRDQIQQAEIDSLKTELRGQKRRSVVLEKLLRRLKTRKWRAGVPQDVSASDRGTPSGGDEADTQATRPASRIRRAENEQPVAFYATLATHTHHAGINQNIVFDHVITNVGNAYSNSLGAFVAPVSGIYVFAVNLMAYGHETEHFQLAKNGHMVSRLYARADVSYDPAVGLTAVLQLAQGDNVEIQFLDADGDAYGYHYSSFAGFLLQQDYGMSGSIVGK